MLTFAVISVSSSENTALNEAVVKAYGSAYFRAADNFWLVADNGVTAQEVTNKLGVGDGGIGGTIVLLIGGYFGYAPKNIWDWLNVKTSAP